MIISWARKIVCIAATLALGITSLSANEGASPLIEQIWEENYKDLASLFEQASDIQRLKALRLMLPTANREISAAMLSWLETQSFLVAGSEEATRTKMIWRETAILIAKGLGVELEKTPFTRREYLAFCADMKRRLSE